MIHLCRIQITPPSLFAYFFFYHSFHPIFLCSSVFRLYTFLFAHSSSLDMPLEYCLYQNCMIVSLLLFTVTNRASALSETDDATSTGSSVIEFGSPQFWGQIVAIIALVICSGIVAGLTLGLVRIRTDARLCSC
ncbi:hypothetical protein BX666DRAFT_1139320 [Dichotomocladium elegans]|nr:hypothetical protein BX666DRAFT_1139320 [Dichotomocladium elegans]